MDWFWGQLGVEVAGAALAGVLFFLVNCMVRARCQLLVEWVRGTLPVRWLLESRFGRARIIIGATKRRGESSSARNVSRAELHCACSLYHGLKERWPSKLGDEKRLAIYDCYEVETKGGLGHYFEVVIGGPKRNSLAAHLERLLRDEYEHFPWGFRFYETEWVERDGQRVRVRGGPVIEPMDKLREESPEGALLERVVGVLVKEGDGTPLDGQPSQGQPVDHEAIEDRQLTEYVFIVKATFPARNCGVLWIAGTRGESNGKAVADLLNSDTGVAAELRHRVRGRRDEEWAAVIPVLWTGPEALSIDTDGIQIRKLRRADR